MRMRMMLLLKAYTAGHLKKSSFQITVNVCKLILASFPLNTFDWFFYWLYIEYFLQIVTIYFLQSPNSKFDS